MRATRRITDMAAKVTAARGGSKPPRPVVIIGLLLVRTTSRTAFEREAAEGAVDPVSVRKRVVSDFGRPEREFGYRRRLPTQACALLGGALFWLGAEAATAFPEAQPPSVSLVEPLPGSVPADHVGCFAADGASAWFVRGALEIERWSVDGGFQPIDTSALASPSPVGFDGFRCDDFNRTLVWNLYYESGSVPIVWRAESGARRLEGPLLPGSQVAQQECRVRALSSDGARIVGTCIVRTGTILDWMQLLVVWDPAGVPHEIPSQRRRYVDVVEIGLSNSVQLIGWLRDGRSIFISQNSAATEIDLGDDRLPGGDDDVEGDPLPRLVSPRVLFGFLSSRDGRLLVTYESEPPSYGLSRLLHAGADGVRGTADDIEFDLDAQLTERCRGWGSGIAAADGSAAVFHCGNGLVRWRAGGGFDVFPAPAGWSVIFLSGATPSTDVIVGRAARAAERDHIVWRWSEDTGFSVVGIVQTPDLFAASKFSLPSDTGGAVGGGGGEVDATGRSVIWVRTSLAGSRAVLRYGNAPEVEMLPPSSGGLPFTAGVGVSDAGDVALVSSTSEKGPTLLRVRTGAEEDLRSPAWSLASSTPVWSRSTTSLYASYDPSPLNHVRGVLSADGHRVFGRRFGGEEREPLGLEDEAAGSRSLGVFSDDAYACEVRLVARDGRAAAGVCWMLPGWPMRVFTWSEARGIRLLPPILALAGESCRPVALIAEDASVIGTCSTPSSHDSPSSNATFRWSIEDDAAVPIPGIPSGPGAPLVLHASSDGRVLAGDYGRPFRWTEQTGLELLPDTPTGPPQALLAMSGDGSTFVVLATRNHEEVMYRLRGTSFERIRSHAEGTEGLDPADDIRIFTMFGSPKPFVRFVALSHDGGVVAANWAGAAFVWDRVHGERSLLALLTTAAWPLTRPLQIRIAAMSRDGGLMVGTSYPTGGNDAVVSEAVEATGRAFLLRLSGSVDHDGDGVPNELDRCPFAFDPAQSDRGGVGDESIADGVGDVCQCGDIDADGRVTGRDVETLQRALLAGRPLPPSIIDRCDVGGSPGCTLADAVVIRRALATSSGVALARRCAPAIP